MEDIVNNVQSLARNYSDVLAGLREILSIKESVFGGEHLLGEDCGGRWFSPDEMHAYLLTLGRAAYASKKCLRLLRLISFNDDPTSEQVAGIVKMREYTHEEVLYYIDAMHSDGVLLQNVQCHEEPCFQIGDEDVVRFTYTFSDRAVYEMYQRTFVFEIRDVARTIMLLNRCARRSYVALLRTFCAEKWRRLSETPLLFTHNKPEDAFRLLYRPG